MSTEKRLFYASFCEKYRHNFRKNRGWREWKTETGIFNMIQQLYLCTILKFDFDVDMTTDRIYTNKQEIRYLFFRINDISLLDERKIDTYKNTSTERATKNKTWYRPLLEGYDDQMFALAEKWKDFASFDLIGDDNAFCSAFFVAAKFAEVAGSMTNIDDAENWCHLPFFQKNPDRIGTILVAERQQNDRSRIRETVHQAAGIGRPVLLVADGTKEDFGITEDIAVCTVPAAPAGFDFVSALMQYIPGSLLAGYVSTLLHEPFFRGRAGAFADPGRPIFYSNVEVVS